ncbi:MBL fold metallo-hydrolase RNA specificity domain-containing protein [Rhodanobacter lindaniclasticus]
MTERDPLAGYQAGGTRGAALAAGKRTLRMFGREVPIRAEVVQLEGFSGHADAGELLDWMRTAPSAPRVVYLTHGEPDAADTLRGRGSASWAGARAFRSTWSALGWRMRDAASPPLLTPCCASPVPASTPTSSRWCTCTATVKSAARKALPR